MPTAAQGAAFSLVELTQKRCSRCGETKPLSGFHRHRSRADGRQRYCRSCNLAVGKAWKIRHHDRGLELARRWQERHRRYFAVHKWLDRHHTKRGICEQCDHVRATEWANISGEYRRDRKDFRELCGPCHLVFDEAKKAAA